MMKFFQNYRVQMWTVCWLMGLVSASVAQAPLPVLPAGIPNPVGGAPTPAAVAAPGDAIQTAQAPAQAAVSEPALDRIAMEAPPVHSLFYTQEEINLLMQAAIAYERTQMNASSDAQNQAKNFLNQLESKNTSSSEGNGEYPQFFLESLVYHTPTDWFVQINGQKFTPDKPEKNTLKILSADAEKVVVEWKPFSMQLVLETLSKARNNQVDVDRSRGIVAFTLRPNQTFTSYLMQTVEGKVRPVSLKMK